MSAAALLAAPTIAQTPVKVLEVGDAGWSGLKPIVTGVFEADVNNAGETLVYASGGTDTVNNNAVLKDGVIFQQEGTQLNLPASHMMPGVNDWRAGTTVDSLDINDNGDISIHWRSCRDLDGIVADHDIVFWTSGATGTTYAILEEATTVVDTLVVPMGSGLDETMGATIEIISQVWQNNSNQMIVYMQTTTHPGDDKVVFVEHDGAGVITSMTLIAKEGEFHDVVFGGDGAHLAPIQGFAATKQYSALNDSGDYLYYLDDVHSGGGSTLADAHIYIYSHTLGTQTEQVIETDLSPTGASNWNHMSSMEMDINDSGDWIIGGDDDGPSGSDYFLATFDTMGVPTLQLQEGSPAPAPVNAFNVQSSSGFGACRISDSGDITYHLEWDDVDQTIDKGIFRNTDLLVQEGTTLIGADLVEAVSNSAGTMTVSDDGRFITMGLTVAGNFGVYVLDTAAGDFPSLCNGDGGDQVGCTHCPCGNNSPIGTEGGCLNSAGSSAKLGASGNTSVSLSPGVSTDLRLTIEGAPAGALCVMQSGDAVAPQNMMNLCFGLDSGVQSMDRDGLRCAVQATKRHGSRSADGMGMIMDSAGPSRVWGGEAQPNGGIFAQGGFVAGQTRFFQVNYRENVALVCMRGLNSSQAVQVTFVP